jgi:hypothetical protein
MDFIDYKYIGLISSRLPKFKKKGTVYNFRCPICGDSKNDKNKTRGYLLEKKGNTLYFCHNCGASMSLGNFIKFLDPEVHKEYTQEKFVNKNTDKQRAPMEMATFEPPKFIKNTALSSLKKVSQLEWNHPVKTYVTNRLIPPKFHCKLFFAPKFKEWVNSLVPNKFDTDVEGFRDEPRLIIPFIDQQGNLFAFQGRSFSNKGIRYITIVLNSDVPKLYGLDNSDLNKPFYVTEGPIDSMFLDNAIAMAGADLPTDMIDKKNATIIFDNEPRNKEIVKRIEKYIDLGFKVAIWPDYIPYKDINEMVLNGMKNIDAIIKNNTYEGLYAKMRLTSWKKI